MKRPNVLLLGAAALLGASLVVAAPQWGGGMMGMMGGPGMMGGSGMMGGPGMMQGSGMVGGQRGMGPGAMGKGPMDMTQMHAQLDALERQLNLTDDQRPHWRAFRETVDRQAASMQSHHQRMLSALGQAGSMTLPERVDLHRQLMGERFASMTLFTDALTTLYRQLDPGQQQILDRHPIMGGM